MLIGVLHEGRYDTEAVKVLISRILDSNISIDFDLFITNGPIIGKMDVAMYRFFEQEKKCDFVVFLTDQDKDKKKKKNIKEWVKKYESKNPGKNIILGLPKPSFEQWLILDENCVKSFLNCDNSKPLPFADIKHPKPRLKQLALKYDKELTRSIPELYCDIAKKIDFSCLMSDVDFKSFYKGICNASRIKS